MITAGIDAGQQNTKAVLVNGRDVLALSVLRGGHAATALVAQRALGEAIEKAGISARDVAFVAATGSGRDDVPFAHERPAEFICLAKGVAHLFPRAAMVLDIGAEKSLAVQVRDGNPVNFAGNDRCASGCGRYLEMVADILGLPLRDIGALSLRSTEDVEVMSQCAVFAESEIISLIHVRKKPEDILRGVFRGLVKRAFPLVTKAGCQHELIFAGGVARNVGVVEVLQEQLKSKVLVPENPEIVAALGAAIRAGGRANGVEL